MSFKEKNSTGRYRYLIELDRRLFRHGARVVYQGRFFQGAFVLLCLACNNPEVDKGSILPHKITILPESEVRNSLVPCSRDEVKGVTSTWRPTTDDVRAADNKLREFLGPRLKQPLDNYYRQYVGIVMNGKLALNIHAFEPFASERIFENEMPEWRSRYLNICDGGDSVWGLQYFIDDQKFTNFDTNGP